MTDGTRRQTSGGRSHHRMLGPRAHLVWHQRQKRLVHNRPLHENLGQRHSKQVQPSGSKHSTGDSLTEQCCIGVGSQQERDSQYDSQQVPHND